MARLTPLLVALLVAATIAAQAKAEEDEEESSGSEGGSEDEDDDDDDKASGVTLHSYFIGQTKDSPQPRIFAGKEAEALIGFDVDKESGSMQKVEFVRAHLESVSQPGFILQNMTGQLYNRTIEPGETATLVYKFTPAKEIEPRDYSLILNVWFHEGEDEAERTTQAAYNGTVTILDSTSAVDLQMLFMLVVLGAIGFGLWKLTQKNKKTRGGGGAAAASTTREKSVGKVAADDDGVAGGGTYDSDFIPKEHLQARKRSASGGRKSK